MATVEIGHDAFRVLAEAMATLANFFLKFALGSDAAGPVLVIAVNKRAPHLAAFALAFEEAGLDQKLPTLARDESRRVPLGS